ncbi:MAG: alpha/beta hydrolase family esterase [Leptonema sp. (in: bacteria)]
MWNKLLLLLFFVSVGCSVHRIHFTDPNYYWFKIEYQNTIRKNIIYFPSLYEKSNKTIYEETRTFPLIISLHGGGGNFDSNLILSKGRLLELKEKYHFFLILPEGYKKQWNDGRNFDPNINSINDVGYLKTIIKYAIENFPINRDQIFIFGISNGGMMSFRFACESSEWIEGFASIAATMPKQIIKTCNPRKKLKFLLIHGTQDPLVPYEGGVVKVFFKERGEVLSAEETIDFWIKKNQCSNKKSTKEIKKNNKLYTEIRDYECLEKKIRFYKIFNGGHTWPGGYQYLPEWYIGKTITDFNADEAIIKFFFDE